MHNRPRLQIVKLAQIGGELFQCRGCRGKAVGTLVIHRDQPAATQLAKSVTYGTCAGAQLTHKVLNKPNVSRFLAEQQQQFERPC